MGRQRARFSLISGVDGAPDHYREEEVTMALCSRCGGVEDLYPLPVRAAVSPIEADPYCPACGQPRHTTCLRCGGSGYVEAKVSAELVRDYCARCGEPIVQKARASCPACGGSGRTGHFCSGWAWYARGDRPPEQFVSITTSATGWDIALRPRRSRALVKVGR